jgi:hypothetical protein
MKFSHNYDQIPCDFQWSSLLDILPVKLEDLSDSFMVHGHEALPHTWMDEKRAYYPNLLSI